MNCHHRLRDEREGLLNLLLVLASELAHALKGGIEARCHYIEDTCESGDFIVPFQLGQPLIQMVLMDAFCGIRDSCKRGYGAAGEIPTSY